MPRVLLVTGSSRGIGAATARLAAARGYVVCVNFRQHCTAADALVDDICRDGGHAIAVQADVSAETDVLRLFATIDETLGPIDALVNNAGVIDKQTAVEGLDAARMQRIFATNAIGTMLCAREATKRMKRSRGGRGGAIVNVSSAASRSGSPGEYLDYAASKGAVDAFTTGLAAEVAAEGIRVNAVRPGFIRTGMHASAGEPGRVDRLAPMIPMRRGGEPDEVARAILWLLSDEAAYTTGSFIDVAGGR